VSAPERRIPRPGADTQVCPYALHYFFKDHYRAEEMLNKYGESPNQHITGNFLSIGISKMFALLKLET
jgi:hypothetical protein